MAGTFYGPVSLGGRCCAFPSNLLGNRTSLLFSVAMSSGRARKLVLHVRDRDHGRRSSGRPPQASPHMGAKARFTAHLRRGIFCAFALFQKGAEPAGSDMILTTKTKIAMAG